MKSRIPNSIWRKKSTEDQGQVGVPPDVRPSLRKPQLSSENKRFGESDDFVSIATDLTSATNVVGNPMSSPIAITDSDRNVLAEVLEPVAALSSGQEARKRFSKRTWSKLLSPKGVSVKAIMQLREQVLGNKLAHDVVLVTLSNEFVMEDGGFLKAGTTIQIKDTSGPIWKGKTSYAKGKVVRVSPNQVQHKPRPEWTIEDYCEHVVKPEIKDSQTFYLDEISDDFSGPPGHAYFLSQSRSTKFSALCDAIAHFFKGRNLNKCFVWLDVFCANQGLLVYGHTSPEEQRQRDDVLKHGLHHLISSLDGGCLLLLDDWQKPHALRRAWVMWELLGVVATGSKFEIVLPPHDASESFDHMLSNNIDAVTNAILDVDVQKAECENEEDLKYLRSKWAGHEATINDLVRNQLRGWFASMSKQRGEALLARRKHTDDTSRLLNGAGILLKEMGKFEEALVLLKRAHSISLQVNGPEHLATATILSNLGRLYKTMGKLDKALPLLKRALALSEELKGPSHPDTALRLNNLGTLLQKMGKYKEAKPLLERALKIDERVSGPNHRATAIKLNSNSLLLQKMGRHAEALPMLERTVSISEMTNGPEHPATSTPLHNLALLLKKMGKYDEALPLMERALRISENVKGPEHRSTLARVVNLTQLLQKMGRDSEALPLLRRALAISERVHGVDHPETGNRLNKLARLLHKMGKFDEALPLMRRALAISEQWAGSEDRSTATVLSSLGQLLTSMGRYEEALPLLRRALEIEENQRGAQHPATLATISSLAVLLKSMGRPVEALPLMERLVAVSNEVNGERHALTAIRLGNLGSLLHEMCRYQEAQPLLEQALAISEEANGPKHASTAANLSNLGRLLQDMGKYKEALSLLKRALDIDEGHYGPDHATTSVRLSNLGWVLQDLGKYQEALPLLQRALAISEVEAGPNHPETSVRLNNLGLLLVEMGKYDEAQRMLQRALSIDEEANGPNHISTAVRLNSLGKLLKETGDTEGALELFKRSLSIFERVFEENHLHLAIAQLRYAESLCETHKPEDKEMVEAEELMESGFRKTIAAVGNDHFRTADALLAIGKLHLKLKRHDRAVDSLNGARDILVQVFDSEHPRVLQVDYQLVLGELDIWRQKWMANQLLDKRIRTLGESHPATIRTRKLV